MGMMHEFKEFAMRGNVVDMAVGIIMGGAFGKIVASLVNDVIMPPIGVLMGGIDFKEFSYTLKEPTVVAGEKVPAVVLKYGLFANTVIDFVVVAFCIFVLVKAVNTLQKRRAAAPTPPPQEKLLTEIRDLLKSR